MLPSSCEQCVKSIPKNAKFCNNLLGYKWNLIECFQPCITKMDGKSTRVYDCSLIIECLKDTASVSEKKLLFSLKHHAVIAV